jgi:ABC-type Na+ efflux pump permease subunit
MQTELPESPRVQNVQGLPETESSKSAPGIGGVLIIVAVGLIISLIQNLGTLLANLQPFRRGQVWERLTIPGSIAYHPYWKPVLLFELASSAVILGFNAVAVVLFFRKQRMFPKVIILGIPIIFILILIGYYLSGLIPAIAESPDYSKQKWNLIARFIALHIWIPYFLVSKRVKETFVR